MSYAIFPNQSSVTLNTPTNTGSITIPNGGYTIGGTGSSGSMWTGTATTSTAATITANGKLKIEGENADILINGQSFLETMQTIQDRLAILVPDPKKLEQFEALKQAYEHYKTLEALCCESTTSSADK